MIFPKGKVYSEAFRNLYEYLDVKNIVRKLQDIDKLKLILFDEKQRSAFELLPKPGIGKRKNNNSTLTIESIVKPTNTSGKINLKFSQLLDGNPVNLRIYELLDPKFKNISEKEEHLKKTKKILVESKS